MEISWMTLGGSNPLTCILDLNSCKTSIYQPALDLHGWQWSMTLDEDIVSMSLSSLSLFSLSHQSVYCVSTYCISIYHNLSYKYVFNSFKTFIYPSILYQTLGSSHVVHIWGNKNGLLNMQLNILPLNPPYECWWVRHTNSIKLFSDAIQT